MFEDFFKIDKSMGESRLAQVCGGILLIEIIIFCLQSETIVSFWKLLFL
jgi:hypothetical protein